MVSGLCSDCTVTLVQHTSAHALHMLCTCSACILTPHAAVSMALRTVMPMCCSAHDLRRCPYVPACAWISTLHNITAGAFAPQHVHGSVMPHMLPACASCCGAARCMVCRQLPWSQVPAHTEGMWVATHGCACVLRTFSKLVAWGHGSFLRTFPARMLAHWLCWCMGFWFLQVLHRGC